MKPRKRTITREYVCECDRDLPVGEQTVITLSELTVAEKAVLKDLMQVNSDQQICMNLGTKTLYAWHFGVKSVRNFDGVELERDEKKAFIGNTGKRPWRADILDQFEDKEIEEVADEILGDIELKGEEVKNSQPSL